MNNEKKWYVVNTYSGFEEKVLQKLQIRSQADDMKNIIGDVIIPGRVEERIKKNKNGTEKIEKVVVKFFPGHVLINMVMTTEAWFIVRNTPGVTGFIGSSGKGAQPIPLTQEEVDKIFEDMKIVKKKEIEIGSTVKIFEGPFSGMSGAITKMDGDNLTINIDLFGQVVEVNVTKSEVKLED